MTNEEAMIVEEAIQSARSAHKRLDDLEAEVGDLHKLTEAMAKTAANVENMQRSIDSMNKKIEALTAVPAKRWEAVIGYVMAALVSGVVGAILGMVVR